jgi:hypothetical protein
MDIRQDSLTAYSLLSGCANDISTAVNRISKSDSKNLSDVLGIVPLDEHIEIGLALAYTVVSIYGASLRCDGTDEKKHPISREKERLLSYIKKARSTGSPDRRKRRRVAEDESQCGSDED